MSSTMTRLTEPMVREHGELRTATWDEALDRAAEGLRARHGSNPGCGAGPLQLLEGHQRDELRRTEVRPSGPRHQQHRQLQPHLTRTLGRRSGDRLRCRWRYQLIRGGRAHRPHRAVGFERARRAPDLLPPRPARAWRAAPSSSWSTRGAPSRRRWRTSGSASTSARTSRCRTRSAREIIASDLHDRAFIERATENFDEYAESVGRLDARARRGGHRHPRRRDPRGRARGTRRPTGRMICWTLGITEHHNAVDNVLALINLGSADRPRRASTGADSTRCAARTTCRVAATWARSRTSSRASRTSCSDAEAAGEVRSRLGRRDHAAATAGT